MTRADRLPVHGFVLAGGKSSRMGHDKALLAFRGRPLVRHALALLQDFCGEVSIAGNRDDLACFAPVVHEGRENTGPVAGFEAGLQHARGPWALFVPVDVPLVPPSLLRAWVVMAILRAATGLRISFLEAAGERQPAFCLLHLDTLASLSAALDDGERRISRVLHRVADSMGESALWVASVEQLDFAGAEGLDLRRAFANLNTREDLAAVEGEERGPVSSLKKNRGRERSTRG